MADLGLFSASELAEMDVVYYVKKGERNDELALSLRSLAHFPHRRVHIVGHTPRWVKNVNSIPGNLRPGASGWLHGWDNVRLAASYDGDMTDDVVIFNDDFIALEPVEELPLYWRRPLDEHVLALNLETLWGRSVLRTYEYLEETAAEDPLSYELHVPMPVNREHLDRALADAATHGSQRGEPTDPPHQWRTVYGNRLRSLGLAEGVQRGDVKVKRSRPTRLEHHDFLSTSDRTYRRPRVQGKIRSSIPVRSEYL